MKNKSASQLTEFDVHAFTNIVQETVSKSEQRLKSYIDQKLEEQTGKFDQKLEQTSTRFDQKLEEQTGKFDQKLEEQSKTLLGQMDKKNREQTKELVNLMDKKNRQQTDEICEVIKNVVDSSDQAYVTQEEFKKHAANIRAHQS